MNVKNGLAFSWLVQRSAQSAQRHQSVCSRTVAKYTIYFTVVSVKWHNLPLITHHNIIITILNHKRLILPLHAHPPHRWTLPWRVRHGWHETPPPFPAWFRFDPITLIRETHGLTELTSHHVVVQRSCVWREAIHGCDDQSSPPWHNSLDLHWGEVSNSDTHVASRSID